MSSHLRLTSLAVAGLVSLAACATPGDNAPTAVLGPSAPRFALGAITSDATPELGKLKVCKDAGSNVGGTFEATREQLGDPATQGDYAPAVLATAQLEPGHCIEIADDNGGSLLLSLVRIREVSEGLASVSGRRVDQEVGGSAVTFGTLSFQNGDGVQINRFHGATITFVNHLVAPPPPAVCDFVTFGRLVFTTANGQKVVISGNAGGNAPGGGFLNEFHVEANGVDNHVATIDSYGPITDGLALSGLTNSRIVTGTAKNGVAVELRVYDGGEPGKGTDWVYVSLNGVALLGTNGQTIDQGNIQYHSTCRGPKS